MPLRWRGQFLRGALMIVSDLLRVAFAALMLGGLSVLVRADDAAKPAAATDEQLVVLHEEDIDPKAGAKTFALKPQKRGSSAVRLRLKEGQIDISRVIVEYDNGQVHYEERAIDMLIGERTKPIDPRDDARTIKAVTIVYTPDAAANAKPVVQVLGAQHLLTGELGRAPVKESAATRALATDQVLFGATEVRFGVGQDVIKVGAGIGKFDRIRLRVLGGDIAFTSIGIVYEGAPEAKADLIAVDAEVPANSRTSWIDIDGDRFIKEVQLNYKPKAGSLALARIELFGHYAEGWLGPSGGGRKVNKGWFLLAAKSGKGSLWSRTERIEVGAKAGDLEKLRVTVRGSAISVRDFVIIYASGRSETIATKTRIDQGFSYGPIDIKGTEAITAIVLNYRISLFSEATVEFWGQYSAGSGPAVVAENSSEQYARSRVFFATDRRLEAYINQSANFSGLPSEDGAVTLGEASITVPTPSEGRDENLWSLLRGSDKRRSFTKESATVLSQDDSVAAWKAASSTATKYKGQALLFLHGFNYTFDDALVRAAQIAHDLAFDGPVFVFSWPSQGDWSLTSYTADRERVLSSRDRLLTFMELIARSSGAAKINVVAHSMGNFALVEILRDVAKRPDTQMQRASLALNEIVMAAPDVDRLSFEQGAPAFTPLARGITIYASSQDKALKFSRGLAKGERIGDIYNSKPTVIANVDTIDVSEATKDLIGHNAALDGQQLLADMAILFMDDPRRKPTDRGPIFKQIGKDKQLYWSYLPN